MGWRSWLIAIGLVFMGGLVVSAISIMATAETMVCANAQCVWRWEPASGATRYEVQRFDVSYAVTAPEFSLPPLDRTGTSPMQIRVRGCDTVTCGPWSERSEPAIGVPIGWMPLWDRTGRSTLSLYPADFEPLFRAFEEDWRWPD